MIVTGAAATGLTLLILHFSEEPTTYFSNDLVSGQKLVFCDWGNIQAGYYIQGGVVVNKHVPSGVQIQYYRPLVTDPILRADKPWESNFLGLYSTLMYDEGKYRLWYEGYPHLEEQADINCILCYAESVDGITWVKPNLGIATYDGSTANNILFTPDMHPKGVGIHGATVFKDPHGLATERYKMTYCSPADSGEYIVHGAVSYDGLHWTLLDTPLVTENADSQTTVTWDEVKQKYVGYFRHWEDDRRHITYAETDNFRAWPQPALLLGAEASLDPSVDYYTNGYKRWPNATGAHLLFPTMYYRGSTVPPGDHCCVSLGVSRTGLSWQFPLSTPYINVSTPGSGMEGMVFLGEGMASLPNGSWAFSLGCSASTHNSQEPLGAYQHDIRLAIIREDGVTAINASTVGEFWMNPITFSAKEMRINAVTEPAGSIKIELVRKSTGVPITGFTLTDCDVLQGDLYWQQVSWNANEDLSGVSGQEIEIHVQIDHARLHALKFL